jgi:hypothetical protein
MRIGLEAAKFDNIELCEKLYPITRTSCRVARQQLIDHASHDGRAMVRAAD